MGFGDATFQVLVAMFVQKVLIQLWQYNF